MPLFEVKAGDREFYQRRIRESLPDWLIDFHSHVWLDQFQSHEGKESSRAVSWARRVAVENSIQDLKETYRLMFPDKQVLPLIFGLALSLGDDLERGNEYVHDSAETNRLPRLIFADPSWGEAEFEARILKGRFVGAKVYLTRSDPRLPEEEIQIYDFLPHHQLKVLDKHGWIVVLHIPRRGRLRDPLNLAQILEIERRYPNAKVVIAHVGRAYCRDDVGNAFEVLAETRQMRFDISANTSEENFQALIRAVGSRRILFGSDLPVTRMRMRRTCENGTYVNLVPKGLYGDVSGDPHLREAEGAEAEALTFFLYEEIHSFLRAARGEGLAARDLSRIFYDNAAELLCDAGMPAAFLGNRA
jgi:predicted TIM-barrel fold metal-dependent hydrolase